MTCLLADAAGATFESILANTAPAIAAADDNGDRFYNLPWPFPHCRGCPGDDEDATAPVGDGAHPWHRWSVRRQGGHLTRLFPLPGSRIINVVSDECMLKTMLAAHGLVAPRWQSDGFSSHVDWSRTDDQGHPGTYDRNVIELFPAALQQVQPPMRRHLATESHAPPGALVPGVEQHAPGLKNGMIVAVTDIGVHYEAK